MTVALSTNLTQPAVDQLQLAYAAALASLLPPGEAWRVLDAPRFRELLMGLAAEWARVHRRALDLERELDPRETVELLPDWEEFLGLPDPCTVEVLDISRRRAAVLAKLLDEGGVTPQDLIDIAAVYGFEIQIREYRPFRVGQSGCGEMLVGDSDPFMVGESMVGEGLAAFTGWWTFFEVIASAYEAQYFEIGGSSVGTSLGELVNLGLECELRKLVQGHLQVIFTYQTRLKAKPLPVRLRLPKPRMESSTGVEDEDMGFLLTQTSDTTGSDWASSPTINPTGWITLPVAWVIYPYLLKQGWIDWLITGKYFNLTGAPQVVRWELLVDGAPLAVPVVFDFPLLMVVQPNSLSLFKAKLEVVGITNAQPQHALTVEYEIKDLAGATQYFQRASAVPVIDAYVDHEISWRLMRVNAIGGCKLEVQSINAVQPMRRSGG